ncbi:unnamed protein product [Paramecium octaurelia]|uniref:Uncharacterized protein n=1 Tax=Paramecium octaurelia TaxID=43137 RepID=A0A8S1XXT6_PAROT|nr:unnamed protein product [Paramecium octaurelia]
MRKCDEYIVEQSKWLRHQMMYDSVVIKYFREEHQKQIVKNLYQQIDLQITLE